MFHLHRAERTDTLADALTDVMGVGLADPLCPEVVAVPAAGVERWLAQHVSGRIGSSGIRDGIAANIDFCSPEQLAERISAAVVEAGATATSPARDAGSPWRAEAVVFPVLRVLDDTIGDPGMEILARHVGATPETADDSHRAARRYATARHIAELFARYGHSRPTMLADWAAGSDTDGAGAGLPREMGWQPEFWRRVRAVVAQPHPAETLAQVCRTLRDDPDAVPAGLLPERLSVFGPTRITASMLALLSALAVHRDTHVFVAHPSPALWASMARSIATDAAQADVDTRSGAAVPVPGLTALRRRSRPAPVISHPLLASLSRDVQELQIRLAPLIDHDHHHEPVRRASGSVLAGVQADLRADAPGIAQTPAEPDTSIEIHACHGPERQVEVLRDRLLHLFVADETLQPRDVVIMCPDIETFAPLIRGAFGQSGLGHPAFDLRVRLADRGLRHTNAVLDVVASVVELAAGRAGAGEVMDLLSRPPVRERFGFTDDDLDMIREWLSAGNIRWALDGTQRARFGLGEFGQQTFEAGVDRIALGVVADEDTGQWLGRALPLAGVDSTHIDLVGRFAECIDRLSRLLDTCVQTRSAPDWTNVLITAVDELTATTRDDEWQRSQAIRVLSTALDTGDDTGSPVELTLGDVRDLIAAVVAARPTRANFRTGELTVCSMVPMRSVPHRVIILLGIDAEAFPRVQRTDGDDILGVEPVVGERNPRDEDRQMFLDAIGAAGEHLVVFYTGADPVTGSRVPPAVVVSELVDCVAAVTGSDPAGVVVRHSLHGFDRSNFAPGAIAGIPGPFGFDQDLLDGARALRDEPIIRPPISTIELPPRELDDIELSDVIAFLVNPFDAFLRQRLGTRLVEDSQPHPDELDIDLDSLSAWSIGDRFLSKMLAGVDLADCQAAELRRGTLPPFAFGTRALADISDRVSRLHDTVAAVRTGEPVARDVVVNLPDGRRLHGTVGDIFGSSIVTATYSTLRAKQRLTTWVRLIALGASSASGGYAAEITEATVIGRKSSRNLRAARSSFVLPDDPIETLFDLVRLRDAGLRTPLPLPLDCAAEFAELHTAENRMSPALQAARRSFDRDFGASADRSLRFLYGGSPTARVTFDELLVVGTPANREIDGVALRSAPRDPLFCGLAHVVWDPVFTHETTT